MNALEWSESHGRIPSLTSIPSQEIRNVGLQSNYEENLMIENRSGKFIPAIYFILMTIPAVFSPLALTLKRHLPVLSPASTTAIARPFHVVWVVLE